MARRDALIDAVRAIALAGILQVNIQSFVWGAGEPLGYFSDESTDVDVLVHGLVNAFVSSKFIALFALLFGVGAALQLRALRRAGAPWSIARAAYRRRLAFLLAIGILHGVLLYFGDVLTLYALCGFLLLLHVNARPAQLARVVRRWWLAFVAVTIAGALLFAAFGRLAAPEAYGGSAGAIAVVSLQNFEIFTTGSYLEQLLPRLAEYVELQLVVLLLATPQVMALFTLGLLGGRLGWLTRPSRHPRVWLTARRIGLAALPVAVAGAVLNTTALLREPGLPSVIGGTLITLSTPLAALYLAAIVARRNSRAVQRIIAWLAPAGRMPLTNYLMQSVLMGALLSGWGLGLGARLDHAALALMALAIVVVQWIVSRWWIARFGSGPIEAAWRQATYRDLRPVALPPA